MLYISENEVALIKQNLAFRVFVVVMRLCMSPTLAYSVCITMVATMPINGKIEQMHFADLLKVTNIKAVLAKQCMERVLPQRMPQHNVGMELQIKNKIGLEN